MNKKKIILIIFILVISICYKNVYAAEVYTPDGYAFYDPVNGSACDNTKYWTPYNQNTTCYRFIILTEDDTSSKSTVKLMLDHNAVINGTEWWEYNETNLNTLANSYITSWTHYTSHNNPTVSLPDKANLESLISTYPKYTIALTTNTLYSLNDQNDITANYHTTHGYWLSGANSTYMSEFGSITAANNGEKRAIRPVILVNKTYLRQGDINTSNIHSTIKDTSKTQEYKYQYLNKTFGDNNVTYKQMQGFTVANNQLIFNSSNVNNPNYGLIFSYGNPNYSTNTLSESSADRYCNGSICAKYKSIGHGNDMTHIDNYLYILVTQQIDGKNLSKELWKENIDADISHSAKYKADELAGTLMSGKYKANFGNAIGYDTDKNYFVFYKSGRIIMTNSDFNVLYTFDAPSIYTVQGLEYHNGYIFLTASSDDYSARVYVYDAKFNSDGTPSKNFGKVKKIMYINNTSGSNDIGEIESISFDDEDNVWLGYASQQFDSTYTYKFYRTQFSNVNDKLAPTTSISKEESDTETTIKIKSTSNDELKSAAGWTLSSDKLTLSKSYSDAKPAVHQQVCDRYNNCNAIVTPALTMQKQNISFASASITRSVDDEPYTLAATTSGGVIPTYSSSDTSVATVDAHGRVTTKKVGTATITATAEKTDAYYKGTTSYILSVVKANQIINFDTTTVNKTYGDASFSVLANHTVGDGAVTYSSSDTSVATVTNSGVVMIRKAGTATITATAAATENYNSASASYTLNVAKKNQTISFEQSYINKKVNAQSFTLVPNGTYHGALTFISSNTNVATINNNGDVTIVGEGTTVITVITAATENYNSASASCALTIAGHGQPQEISFDTTAVNKTFGASSFTKVANHTVGDGTVTYSSSNTNVATVNNSGKVTITGAGTTTITATASETDIYISGSTSYTLNVAKSSQNITFDDSSIQKKLSDKEYTINAARTKGDGEITYSSSNTEIATVDNNGHVIMKKIGEVTITATASATSNYNESSASYTLNISKGDQIIIIDGIDNELTKEITDKPFKLQVTLDTGDGNIVYSSSDSNVAEISSDGTITIKNAGTTTISVIAEATDNYIIGVKTFQLKVNDPNGEVIVVPDTVSNLPFKILKIMVALVLITIGSVILIRFTNNKIKLRNS